MTDPTECRTLRLDLRGDTAALHRVSAVLAHQRVPLLALCATPHPSVPGCWRVRLRLAALPAHATDQLVGRLRRQHVVLGVDDCPRQEH